MIVNHKGVILLPRLWLPREWRPRRFAPRYRLTRNDLEAIRASGVAIGWTLGRRALPDYFKVEPGTAVVWGEAGASGVTLTMTLDALANTSARMGAVADLGTPFDKEQGAMLVVESGTAPTAATTVELYFASTHSTSFYPNSIYITGSDGAWPGDGNEDEHAKQLEGPVVVLKATNDGTTIQGQGAVIWEPPGRYNVPVVSNKLGQAFRDEVTATNNDSRVILVPRRELIQDAA